MHPAAVMGKRSSPCGRTDGAVKVEDHGNGFMFIGTSDIKQATRLVSDYVDNPEDYVFAARVWYEDQAEAVWLAVEPFAAWEGASHWDGTPLPR